MFHGFHKVLSNTTMLFLFFIDNNEKFLEHQMSILE